MRYRGFNDGVERPSTRATSVHLWITKQRGFNDEAWSIVVSLTLYRGSADAVFVVSLTLWITFPFVFNTLQRVFGDVTRLSLTTL